MPRIGDKSLTLLIGWNSVPDEHRPIATRNLLKRRIHLLIYAYQRQNGTARCFARTCCEPIKREVCQRAPPPTKLRFGPHLFLEQLNALRIDLEESTSYRNSWRGVFGRVVPMLAAFHSCRASPPVPDRPVATIPPTAVDAAAYSRQRLWVVGA